MQSRALRVVSTMSVLLLSSLVGAQDVDVPGNLAMGGVAFVARAAAADDGGCSNATLHGSYGFRQQGTVFATGLQGGVGVTTFDGAGHYFVSGTFVNQTNGVNHATGTGTYAVNPDCSGSLVTDSDPTNTQDFVIVDGGKEYFQIATRGDRVVVWVFKKQFPRREDGEKD